MMRFIETDKKLNLVQYRKKNTIKTVQNNTNKCKIEFRDVRKCLLIGGQADQFPSRMG